MIGFLSKSTYTSSFSTVLLHFSRTMSVSLGTVFPNFSGKSTQGDFNLYEYFANNWGILFSHPNIFTPVCTSEISRLTQVQSEFQKRNIKVVVLSISNVENQKSWVKDISHVAGEQLQFPMVGDESGEISERIGIVNQVYKSIFSILKQKLNCYYLF